MGIEACSATTIDSYQFCRGMTPPEGDDYSKPIGCIEPATEFTTTDTAVYIITKLSSLVQDDEVDYKVSNPSGEVIDEDSLIVLQNISIWYDYREIRIADQNLQPGEYTVKININSNGVASEVVSDKFIIEEDVSDMCEPQGLYCCPSTKVCLSAQEGICDSGACCESEAKCVAYSSSYFIRREVTNCDTETMPDGSKLQDCKKILRLYAYNLHGRIEPPQTGVIYFRGIDVDCTDKKDVAIAYYDEGTGTWVEKVTKVEKTDASGSYKATALLDHLGYIALVRTSQCVPMFCTYGGYRTKPVGGYVNFGEAITFKLCGMINGCDATKDGTCNKKCSDSVDLDCTTECTSQKGDCCLISYDGVCDLDCGPDMDPDCCVKPNDLCCPGDKDSSGYSGCDKNCDTSDTKCSACSSSEGDCCNPASGDGCDPDCPKLGNGVGYLDPDCCIGQGIPITSKYGDCCSDARDDACDFDCIAGLDLDCIFTGGYCGDRKCSGDENPSNCPTDCYCGDTICSDPYETCASCEVDCGKCCGNGVCDNGEDSETCSVDCTTTDEGYTDGW